MKELTEVLRLVLEIVIAATVLVGALEARRIGRRTKRIERELGSNPAKSAEATVKRLNGSLSYVPPGSPPANGAGNPPASDGPAPPLP